MNEEQLLSILRFISNSLLISELNEQSTLTSDSNFLVINQGSEDAKKIKIPLIRGYKGSYNASTNTPNLSNGIGLSGDTYTVSVSGSIDFGNGFINLVINDVIWYNGSDWVKLTQSQITDITNLESILNGKASLNGSVDEVFKVSDGVDDNDSVNLKQLRNSASYLNTSDNFYVDVDGKLWLNLSTYKQSITYISGTQTFTLDFEPTDFIGIFINGQYIDESDYTYTSPNQLTISGTLENGDFIRIIYEHFINPPVES